LEGRSQHGKPIGLALLVLLALSVVGLPSLTTPQADAQGTALSGIGPWTEQTDYGAASGTSGSGGIHVLGVSCVQYQGVLYCVGGQDPSGSDISKVFFAPVSSSGTVGAWTETTDYGAASGTSGSGGTGIEWPSCVQYNGYIYCMGGATNGGIVSKVFFAELSSSGVGPWTETTDYGASSGATGSGGLPAFQLSCVEDSGFAYCAGSGFGTSKVFYAQLSPTGVGPWTETTDYGATSGSAGTGGVSIASTACVDSSGYMYCVGGTSSFKPVSDVFYAPLSSSGVGPWTETTDYGASSGTTGSGGVPIYGTSCVVYSGNIICIDGDTTGNTGTNGVYFSLDPADLAWQALQAFVTASYWWSCNVYGGYVGCYGAGTSQGYSAQVMTPGTVTKAQPTLTTSLSGGVLLSNGTYSMAVGDSVKDSAMLSGGKNPTGTVAFYLYSGTGACSLSAPQVGKDNETLGPAGTAQSTGFPISKGGFYSVMVIYSGDANNEGTYTCERFTAAVKDHPIIHTTLNSTTITAGSSVFDTSGMIGTSAFPSGTISYYNYVGVTGNPCATSPRLYSTQTINPEVSSNSPSSPLTFSTPGTYGFVAVYSGDANNAPATSECETLTVTAPSNSGGGGSQPGGSGGTSTGNGGGSAGNGGGSSGNGGTSGNGGGSPGNAGGTNTGVGNNTLLIGGVGVLAAIFLAAGYAISRSRKSGGKSSRRGPPPPPDDQPESQSSFTSVFDRSKITFNPPPDDSGEMKMTVEEDENFNPATYAPELNPPKPEEDE